MSDSETGPSTRASAYEPPPAGRLAKIRRAKWVILGLGLVLSAIWGFVDAPHDPGVFDGLLLPLAMLALIVAWCYYDSAECEQPLPLAMVVGIMIFWPISLPIYLLVTHGRRGWWYVLGAAVYVGLYWVAWRCGGLLA